MKNQVNPTVSVVIPFYNEEKTIGAVVKTALENSRITEIVCINDGSSDTSLKQILPFKDKITLISFPNNHGKGHALSSGIEKAKGDIVVFLDADIINLKSSDIDKLIQPFSDKKIRAVLGYHATKSYLKVFLPLTGERAYYRKDLLSHLDYMRKKGYGVETYLNNLYSKKETKIVKLQNLKLLYKYEKHGVMRAVKNETKSHMQVLKEVGRQTKEIYRYFLLTMCVAGMFFLVGTILYYNETAKNQPLAVKDNPAVQSKLKSFAAFSEKIAPYLNHSKFNYQ